MNKILIIKSFLFSSFVCTILTACYSTQMNGKVVVQSVSVNNSIGTSPQIGPATETITINGTKIPQFSTVLVNAPITANSPVTISYNGMYPCQKAGCTVPLQLPSSCYATSGNVTIRGMLTYNVVSGYFIEGLNCTPYKNKK